MSRTTVFTLVLAACGFGCFAALARSAEPEQASRVDLYGDPLPRGAIARLGTMRYRQQDSIQSAVFTADGRLLVVTSSAGLRYYDTATGTLLESVPVDGDYVTQSAVSRDRRRLVLACVKQNREQQMQMPALRLELFDVASGRKATTITPGGLPGELLAVSGDGSTVGMVDVRGSLRIWDVAGGVEILKHQLQNVRQPRSLTFSPQGDVLAVGGSNVVLLWSWVDQAAPRLVRLADERKRQEAISLDFSPDGSQLAVGIDGWGEVLLVDTTAGKVQHELSGERAMRAYVRDVAFSPDGLLLASTQYRNHNAGVVVWDIATTNKLRELPSPSGGPSKVCFSVDGALLAGVSSFDSTLEVWKTATGERVTEIEGHVRAPLQLHFSSDGKSLISASDDGTIRFWETATGRQTSVLSHADGDANVSRWVRSMAVSPDDRLVVSSSLDDTVRLWDATTGKEIYRWPGHGRLGGYRGVAFSRDGRRVVSVGDDYRVYVWDVKTGKAIEENRLAPTGVQVPDPDDPDRGMDPFGAGGGFTFHLSALSPDGSLLVLPTAALHLFDPASGKELRKLEALGRLGDRIVIAPDNRLFVERGIQREGTEQSSEDHQRAARPSRYAVSLRRVEDGATVREIPVEDSRRGPIAFSPDGRLLAVSLGADQKDVRVFDASTGQEAGRLADLDSRVVAIAFSPDNKLLATSHFNGNVLIWDSPVAAQTQREK
jgi:WD40 repeat protein